MNLAPAPYRWVSCLLAPVIAVHALARARRDGGWGYLRERYGFHSRSAGPFLWLHCASVGEVTAAIPLAHALTEAGWGPLVVSTNTPTGRALATDRAPQGTQVVYLPVDRPRPVQRFLARIRPRAALILETELWPHLFAGLAEQVVPIVIVNARLSRRSLEAPAWWRRTAAWCLEQTTSILARSSDDAAHFEALGAPRDRLRTLGNLKHAAPAGAAPEPIDLGRPFVLAASTHHDEEAQLARAWAGHGDAATLLAIAPRHPERGDAIARELVAAGWCVAQRSRGEAVPAGPGIYVADTLGELPALMAAARVVIMGGSFIAHGGQNVLEPARAGRAIVTGPHMANFADETAGLADAGALARTADADEAVTQATCLLADDARRAAMGAAAAAWAAREADMARRYVEALARILPQPER